VTGLDTWRAGWNKDFLNEHNKIRLLRLLWEFRSRGSSELRDKVYALLPLVNDWGKAEPLKPQYELDVAGVYKIVVRTIIEVEKSLDFLMGNTRKSKEMSGKLATWIPDWSERPTDGEIARLERANLYAATPRDPGCVLHYRPLGRNKFLELHGVNHDTVEEVSEVMPKESNAKSYAAIQKVFSQWQKLARLKKTGNHQYIGRASTNSRAKRDTKMMAFAKTICMDTIYVGRDNDENDLEINKKNFDRTPPNYRDTVFLWKQPYGAPSQNCDLPQLDQPGQKPKAHPTYAPPAPGYSIDGRESPSLDRTESLHEHEASKIDKAVESATVSRRFFITQKGYMGLGPADTKKDDFVFVLCGGSVPFILRDGGKHRIPTDSDDREAKRSRRRSELSLSGSNDSGYSGSERMEDDLEEDENSTVGGNETEAPGPSLQADNDKDNNNNNHYYNSSIANVVEHEHWDSSTSHHNDETEGLATIEASSDWLKHSEEHQGDRQQCYSLVGDCFVHGIMDGEAMYKRELEGTKVDIEPDLVYLI
jgi:hypothetical protein